VAERKPQTTTLRLSVRFIEFTRCEKGIFNKLLEQAKAELENAKPNKGGHRERAMQLVDQAMQEVREGERYDQTHPGSL
jgi:phage/plasmid primase-like uncharacterized protein